MALPTSIDSTSPAGSASPSLGDDQIRAFKLAVLDILGLPDATSITQAAMDMDAGGLAQIIFADPAVTPASGELGRSGSTLYYRITDARTATTTRPLGIIADTSGSPAASIGVGLLFQAESADETPSDFGALDFVASDIGAGTEDTYASILLRVAGVALDEKYRFSSTAGSGFAALFTHAVTADRTFTLPDATGTFSLIANAETFSGVKTFTAAPIVAVEDARTATVLRPFTVRATTSGSAAASIGVGILFDAESADESPSNFGAVDFTASDIGAGTEDTFASLLLRVAGGALDEKYRFSSTAGSGFAALLTHAVTADRTYTFPDDTGTFDLINAAQTVSAVKTFTAAPIVAVEDSRTNTTLRPFTVRATTSGSPAASLGVGVLLQAESGDENPSNFAALDAVASDVTAATEDTDLLVMLRAAGAALAEKFRVRSTGALLLTSIGATPEDGELARNVDTLTWRVEDSRTNTTLRALAVTATTSGSPAASLGVGALFQAESGNENPADFGALDFIATDVTAASEDTVFGISLRTAGAALGERYRFAATGAFLGTFTHANTAARTYTLPDESITLGAGLETGTNSDVTGSRALDTIYQNTSGRTRRVIITLNFDTAGEGGILQIDSTTAPATERCRSDANGVTLGVAYAIVMGFVPNNHYYRLVSVGSPTLRTWTEVDE